MSTDDESEKAQPKLEKKAISDRPNRNVKTVGKPKSNADAIHGGMHVIKDGMLAMTKAMGQPVSTTNTGDLRELQELIIKSQESTSAAVKDVLTAVRESNENMTRLIQFMMQQNHNTNN